MSVGDKIKKRRVQLDMTQQQLADKLGYKSGSAVNKVEAGLRDINQTKIVDYARALETTPSYLMGWTEEVSNKKKITPSSSDNEAIEIFNKLSEEKKQQALDYIKFIFQQK